MFGIALSALEAVLNRYLKLDPDTITRLKALDGKVIELNVTDWNVQFYLVPNANGLSLYSSYSDPADTIISGTLNALFQVSRSRGKTAELFNHKIETSGDMETGEKIRDILGSIDIDWEEQLSKLVGDIPANKVGNLARKLKQVSLDTRQTLELNLKEFLQLELNALPTQDEVSHFCAEVTELRNAVERAEARIKLIESRGKLHP